MYNPRRTFLLLSCFLLLLSSFPMRALAAHRVVIYAAHGGDDRGVSANGQVEKEWTLRLAQSLQKALAAYGFDVVMIRSRDESISFDKWVSLVNSSSAGAALIIHTDREWTGRIRGPYAIVEPPTGSVATDGQELQRWGIMPFSQFRQSLRLAKALAQAWEVNSQLSTLSDSRALPGEPPHPDGRVLASPTSHSGTWFCRRWWWNPSF